MGRPKKPTALHALTGTARKDRTNNAEPKPKLEKPRTPSHLSTAEKKIFKSLTDELTNLGVLTKIDGMALELLSSAYVEYLELTDILSKEGQIYEVTGTSGDVIKKAHPSVAMRSDAWKRVKAMMAEFGITPATRSNVSAIIPVEVDRVAEYRNRRKKKPT